jgi:hypothetical protein
VTTTSWVDISRIVVLSFVDVFFVCALTDVRQQSAINEETIFFIGNNYNKNKKISLAHCVDGKVHREKNGTVQML